jgi:hypothetical protein
LGRRVANTKAKQPEYFYNLEPVFIGDGTEVVGFSSPKQRQILKGEEDKVLMITYK